MRKLTVFILTGLSLLFFATGAGAAKWTLMVYIDAENNGLHSAALDDMNEMEWCTDNPEVNILCLFDGNGSSDQAIYYIWGDDGNYDSVIVSPTVDDGGAVIPPGGEADMSDWHTFDNFVDWVIDNYPADEYLVCLWDHGDGIFRENGKPVVSTGLFRGFCGGMKLWQIDDVLEDAAAYIGHDIGVVGFDACLLGQIETGYQLKDAASYVIGSEETEPLDGWDYFAFETVCGNPNASPRELAAGIVNEYLDDDGGNPSPGPTQGAQDVLFFDTDLAAVFEVFCDELLAACYAYESDIVSARNGAWNSSSNPDCKDIYEFAENIAGDPDVPASLRDAAGDFCTSWQTYIVEGGVNNPNDAHGGATVYFPTNASGDNDWNSYMNNITFTETKWDEFLEMYADPYPLYPNYFTFISSISDDAEGGDGDGVPEPGEQVDITVTVRNDGYEDATGVTGTITTDDDVTIDVGTADFGTIEAEGGTAEGTFTVTINGTCPEPSIISFDLAMHSEDIRYDQDLAFSMTVGWGFHDDVEGDSESIWTHSGSGDMWHVEDYRSNSPTHSWKCGGEGSGDYTNNMNAVLVSPGIYVPESEPEFSFWTCYWIEDDGYAYDRGYVHISTDGEDWDQLGPYFTGTQSDWVEQTYDLSSYAGELIYLRFKFYSDVSVTYEGWYIDDISVSGEELTDGDGVVVSDFCATPRGDGLFLSWEAAREEGVLGYDLYRRVRLDNAEPSTGVTAPGKNPSVLSVNGAYTKVNDELITGVAHYRYFDGGLLTGTVYEYLLKAVYERFNIDAGTTTGEVGVPTAFALGQNRPNPFASSSVVGFAVPKPARVQLVLYDVTGRRVADLVDGYFDIGTYEVAISADGLASGVYLLRMSAGGEFNAVKKVVVSR